MKKPFTSVLTANPPSPFLNKQREKKFTLNLAEFLLCKKFCYLKLQKIATWLKAQSGLWS